MKTSSIVLVFFLLGMCFNCLANEKQKIRDYEEIKEEYQSKGYVDIVIQIDDDELMEFVSGLVALFNLKHSSPEIIAYKASARTKIKNDILSSGSLSENDYIVLTILSNTSLFILRVYNFQIIEFIADNQKVKNISRAQSVKFHN